jgi:hypothetical protein
LNHDREFELFQQIGEEGEKHGEYFQRTKETGKKWQGNAAAKYDTNLE